MKQPPGPPGPQRSSHALRRLAAAAGSALFFAVAPATVGGWAPWLLTRWRVDEPVPGGVASQALGGLVVALGVIALVDGFVRFVSEGLGTPAPIAPTEQLVIGGVYRHVRNPMYIAVVGIIIGQALMLGQLVLLWYAATVGFAMAAFVHAYEEPALARRFGEQYERYRQEVPRWWPTLHAWDPRTLPRDR